MMRKSLFLISVAALATAAQAHNPWIKPSTTSLSGDKGYVTVDAGASTDPFVSDHAPMRLDNLRVTAPDGSEVKPENATVGKYRSTFDVPLNAAGTYRIASSNTGLFGGYKLNGEQKRLPRGTTADNYKQQIPAEATDVKLSESISRIETFVTLGAPTALKPSGKGLELEFVTPPTDLLVSQPATVRFTIDGQPAANVEVELIPDNKRYAARNDTFTAKTDAKGQLSLRFPRAGFWWIGARATDNKVSNPGLSERRLSYAASLEVLPD